MLYLVPSQHSLLGDLDSWTCADRSFGCRSQARIAYPYSYPYPVPKAYNYPRHVESHTPNQPNAPRWKIARHRDGLILHLNLAPFSTQHYDVRVTLEKGNLLRVRIFKNQDEDLFEVLMGFRPREKVVFQQDFRLESDLDINSISAIREGNMLKVLLPYSRKQTVKTQRRRIRVDGPKTEVTDAQDAGELPDIRKETKGKEVVMIPAAEEAGPSSITFNDWASGAEEKEEFEKNDHRQEDVAANVEEVKVSRRHEKRMSDDEDGSIEDCEY